MDSRYSFRLCSLSRPGQASSTPSVIIMIWSLSQSLRDRSAGSAWESTPAGRLPASSISACPLLSTKVATAPIFIASSTPLQRSTQQRSNVAGCCSVPVSIRMVFTIFRAERAEKPVSKSCCKSSITFRLSWSAAAPLPMPSERLMITCPGRLPEYV